MSGGLDILIVGVADENLDFIAPDERLKEMFSHSDNPDEYSDDDADKYVTDFYALSNNPNLENPRMFYLVGEHLCGSQIGAGLGYVLFDGNNNSLPKRLNERVFARIPELKEKFVREIESKGLFVPHSKVGVYALNVYDT